jgi:hypothetical protein
MNSETMEQFKKRCLARMDKKYPGMTAKEKELSLVDRVRIEKRRRAAGV